MAYGLEIFDANGKMTYSTADSAFLQIDQFQLAANASVTNAYSFPSTFELSVQLQPINVPPNSSEGYTPEATIVQQTVTVAPFTGVSSEATNVLVLARDTASDPPPEEP